MNEGGGVVVKEIADSHTKLKLVASKLRTQDCIQADPLPSLVPRNMPVL